MNMANNITILFISLFLLIGIAKLFIALWTYNDAKNKNLNATMWTIIVIFVPNLIGLLLYFLIGRNQSMILCDICNSKIPQNSKYCPNCGNKISYISIHQNKNGKKYIITSIISIILIIILFFIFMFKIFLSDTPSISTGTYSIGCIETNIGNNWNVAFKQSNDIFRKNVTIDDNSPKTLSIEYSANQGKAYLYLYREGNTLDMIELPYNSDDIKLDLSKYGNGKITFELKGPEVKNLKFKGVFF